MSRVTPRSWAPILLLLLAGESRAAGGEPPSLPEVFARVDPAVVEIHTTETDLPDPGMNRPAGKIGDEELVAGGDIIRRVLDIPLAAPDSLARVRERIIRMIPGDTVTVTVLRGGRVIDLATTVPPEAAGP